MRVGEWPPFRSLVESGVCPEGEPSPSSELKMERACLQSPPGAARFNYGSGFARDPGSIPGLERSPGGGHGNPLQYSCLENPMDRGAWRATVHRVSVSWTRLK